MASTAVNQNVNTNDLPSGGTTGQTLVKASNANYDTEWASNTAMPQGGSTGQVLTKDSGTDYDTSWQTPSDPTNVTVVPASDHTANGFQTSDLNAGATIAQMDLVYLGSGGKWLISDATDNTTGADKMVAVALEAGTDTNPLSTALKGAFIRDDSWSWTVGGVLYMSLTAGELTQTAPSATDEIIRIMGYAVTATVIYFDPSPDYITVD